MLEVITGDVFIDGIENIGQYSIQYDDLVRDGLPIQTVRQTIDDKVFIDEEQVGDVLVEWEDKVADLVSGTRTLRIAGVVKLVD